MARVRSLPRWAVVLALVILAGGGLRVAAAAHHGRFLSADERAYGKLAAGLASGHGYNAARMQDPLHWPPGAPAAFAVARLVSGAPASRLDPAAVYAAQVTIGVALVLAVFGLTRALAGPWAGVAAASVVALYPPLVLVTGDLVTEPLGALALVGAIGGLAWAWRAPRWPRFAAAGALTALAVLVRADLLVLPLVLAAVVALSLRPAGARAALVAAGAYLAATAVALAPWSAYASARKGSFVPVATSSWSILYVGTYLPGDGRMFGLRRTLGDEARAHNPRLRHVRDANLRAEWIIDAVAARHPELGRTAALRRAALDNVRRYALGRPLDFASMEARKLGRMWLGYARGTHNRGRPWIRAVHILLVATALAGLAAGLWRTRDPVLWAILATLLTATAVNVLFVAEARANARLVPLLVAGGAGGWTLALRGAVSRRGGSAGGPGGRTAPPRASGASGVLPGRAARPRDAARAR